MNKTRIQIARADIVNFFNDYPRPVLKPKEIATILTQQRGFWRLAQRTTTADFLKFLQDHAHLKLVEFKFPQRSIKCYVWGSIPLLKILTYLKSGVHFSHYTAMRMHGLTEQVPTTIFLTDERTTPDLSAPPILDAAQIASAFMSAPRASNNWVELMGRRIYLLNGANTDHLGVVSQDVSDGNEGTMTARVTGLERTLIDIAVKPSYAGGIFEVAKAYDLAKGDVSINKLTAMLRKLNFVYPFHQAIGYYLERAGYKPTQIDLLRGIPIKTDFYLTHGMGETTYIKTWRLFVPKGF